MLGEAGIAEADIVAEEGSHPITSPEDWWLVAMGSGYRGTLAQLDAETLKRVREGNLARLSGCEATATNVLCSVAVR